ncbi:response regulator [Oceanicaulis alexandrii]|uniref:response regulator n=1 Tax=Oceanicaulis TaxID=153232 RepID=UPI0035D12584
MPQSLSVLHVEDDFADAMLLQHALCDAGGYDMELQVVRTLRDARFKLSRKTYDLIIADLRLPDSTQPSETVNLLERQAKGTPILVLSGSAGIDLQSSGDQVKFLDKNDFLNKDLDEKSHELLFWVKSIAQGPSTSVILDDSSGTYEI